MNNVYYNWAVVLRLDFVSISSAVYKIPLK